MSIESKLVLQNEKKERCFRFAGGDFFSGKLVCITCHGP